MPKQTSNILLVRLTVKKNALLNCNTQPNKYEGYVINTIVRVTFFTRYTVWFSVVIKMKWATTCTLLFLQLRTLTGFHLRHLKLLVNVSYLPCFRDNENTTQRHQTSCHFFVSFRESVGLPGRWSWRRHLAFYNCQYNSQGANCRDWYVSNDWNKATTPWKMTGCLEFETCMSK